MSKLKLMLALAVGAAALAAVWAGGAAEADEDRFRFADCSVEFILQDGRFVAVDGRSWAEVDPGGECHETAEDDESSADDEGAGSEGDDSPADDEGAEGEGDDSSADGGGEGSDDSRSAPAGSAADDANQQNDSEDGAGSADGSFEPSLSAGVLEELARWAQENPPDAPPPCTDAVKPEAGPTLISFQNNDHCVIVRYAGVVQVARGDYTLNVTLPAWPAGEPPGLGWRVSSFVHPLVADMFTFADITPYRHSFVHLNAADGVELSRNNGGCEARYFYEGEWVIVLQQIATWSADGTFLEGSFLTVDGTMFHVVYPESGDLNYICGFPALIDAIAASATVPAAE